MPQVARPISDAFVGGYTDRTGALKDIFAALSRPVPDDTVYINSPLAPDNAPYVVKLSPLEDPITSSGHVVLYRYAKNAPGGTQVDVTVQLREGYKNEGSPGKQIAEWSHTNISEVWTTAEQTLTGTQADSISDYSNLFLRFVAKQV